MAPAVSLLPAAAAAGSKRPAASDADPLDLDSSTPPQGGGGGDQDAAGERKNNNQQQQQQQLGCPRCGSTNTKFCYYNNYSTAQPRHFCRSCRRYWTKGGTLRDVPVGGGGNKRRRVSAEPSSATASASPPPASARAEDACAYRVPELPAFPFLADGGIFLPQLDLGLAPEAFSWPPAAAAPDLYSGLTGPWDDGTRGGGAAGGLTGAWDNFADIVGLGLSSWPPLGGN